MAGTKGITVKQAIEQLSALNPEAILQIEFPDTDGCGSCGYGSSKLTEDVGAIHDLETRVVLSVVQY